MSSSITDHVDMEKEKKESKPISNKSADSKLDTAIREYLKSAVEHSKKEDDRAAEELKTNATSEGDAGKGNSVSSDAKKSVGGSGPPVSTVEPPSRQNSTNVDTKDTNPTTASLRSKVSPLNFQVNTSTVTTGSDDMFGDLIDKVVKSSLGVSDSDLSSQEQTKVPAANDSVDKTLNPEATEGAKASLSVPDKGKNNVGAISVSWASKQENSPTHEVNAIQAMSACRVLISPHSFARSTSASSEGDTKDDLEHIAKPSYVTDNGVLDMSKKPVKRQTDGAPPCASPKRFKVACKE